MRSCKPLVALTSATLAAFAGIPALASATWAGKSDRIAYYALAGDDDSAIFTVRPNGENNRRLVRASGGDLAWSRGGRRIAFIGRRGELWQARSNGSKARRILRDIPGGGSASDVVWSPDGRRLAFTASFEDQVEEEIRVRNYVYTVRRDGKGLRRRRRGHDPAWSARGFIAYAQEDGDIATMQPDGSGRRIWVPQGSTAFIRGLDLSPNGYKLVYQQSTATFAKPTIRTLDLRTGRRTRFRDLTKTVSARDIVWAPGGRRIAYLHSPRSGDGPAPADEVRTVRPNGKKRKRLFKLPRDHTAFELAWRTTR